MTKKKDSALEENLDTVAELPTEFAAFVREAGVRAFDALASRLAAADFDEKKQNRMQRLAVNWNSMTTDEKNAFFGQVIAAAAMISAAAPAIKRAAGATKDKVQARKAATKSKRLNAGESKEAATESKREQKDAKKKEKTDKKNQKEKEKKAKKKDKG